MRIRPAFATLLALSGLACAQEAGSGVQPGARFAYTHTRLGGILGFRVDGVTGELIPLPGAAVATDVAFERFTVHPSGRFLYALPESHHLGVGVLDGFAVDQATGRLTPIAGFPLTRPSANGSALTSDGRFLYLADAYDVTGPMGLAISAFAINDTTGALTEIGVDVPLSHLAGGLMIHPSGRFLYVARHDGVVGQTATVVMRIDRTTGALSALYEILPVAGQFEPRGRFLYESMSRGSIRPATVYAVDQENGRIALPGRNVFSSSLNPTDFAFDPSGSYAYVVASYGSATPFLSAYAVQEDGTLREISERLRLSGPSCVSLSADASGRFLYAAASCTRSEVVHGTVSGDPSELSMIAVHPSRRQFLVSPRAPTITGLGAGHMALVPPGP